MPASCAGVPFPDFELDRVAIYDLCSPGDALREETQRFLKSRVVAKKKKKKTPYRGENG